MNLTALFSAYGRPAALCAAGGAVRAETAAIISPLRYKNKMYLDGVNTEIGFNSQGHYLYLGPPTPDLTACAAGDYLQAGAEKYRIDRAERVYCGREVFYIWAIIRVIVETEEST